MASTGPAPVPGSIEDARNKVHTSNFFALCYLMLCQLSYVEEGDGKSAVQKIAELLPTMPTPAGTVTGQWRLGWGPVADNNNSNLMYAAEFMDTEQNPAVPVFTAIVIRGTDVESQPSGLVQQLIEDLDAEKQVAFPENDPNSKIGQGTQLGFQTLSQLPSNGRTVQQYVDDFLKDNSAAPIVVTGHSLGGCQTTVMALDLAIRFPNAVVPTTFAAPTAGNSAFIQLYEQKCLFAPRWFNTRDLVPKAYANLDDIKTLWDPCGVPTPLLVKLAIGALKLLLQDTNYSQESANNSIGVTSICRPAGASSLPPTFKNQTVREIEAVLLRVLTKTQAKGELGNVVGQFEGDIRALGFIQGLPLAPDFDRLLSLVAELSARGLFDWVEEFLYQHLIMTGYWDVVKNQPGVAPIPTPQFD